MCGSPQELVQTIEVDIVPFYFLTEVIVFFSPQSFF